MVRISQRAILSAITALFISATGSVVNAEDATLVPVPDPNYSPQVNTQPQLQQTVASKVCQKLTVAEVYTVKDLTQCGTRIDNSGLGGVFNRGRRCVTESTVAQVFAAPCTCEDCASQSKVAQIRSERGNECTCNSEAYVKALITDLMDGSQRVRNAAAKSLRKCGFKVEHERSCVDASVPSAIFY